MAVTVESSVQGSVCSVEKLWTRLVLQMVFYTWRDRLKKQQLARWYYAMCVRERQRAELMEWHRLAQAEISNRVQRFRVRLAQFPTALSTRLLNSSDLCQSLNGSGSAGQQVVLKQTHDHSQTDSSLELRAFSSISSSEREQHCPLQASSPLDMPNTGGCEADTCGDVVIFSDPHQSFPHHRTGEAIALRVLVRMIQPDLSLAFTQWRTLLNSSRQMRQQANMFTNSRRVRGLRLAFSTWRTHAESQRRAVQHRERVLLSRSVTDWRRLLWYRHKELCGINFHHTTQTKQYFSEWHTQAVSVLNSGWRVEGMQWRVERRYLSEAFSMWSARGRQQKAASSVCTHMVLRRVFTAMQKSARWHMERRAAALSFAQRRLCSAAYSRWKSSWSREQLVKHRAKHTLLLRAKHMLQGWREYTHNRCRMRAHLCVFVEERERAVKRRAFLIWQLAADNTKNASQFYHQTLLYRCCSKWLCVSKQSINLRFISQQFQELRVQRLQQTTFSLWKQRFYRVHSQKQRLCTLARKWTAVSRLRRAERLRKLRLLTLFLRLWRQKLEVKRKRMKTVREAARIWRQHVLRNRWERGKIQDFQKLQLTHAFQYWTQAARWSLQSREHHAQKQRKRVLLAWHIHTVRAQRMRYNEACFQYSLELRVIGSCLSLWKTALIQAQNRQHVLEDSLKLHHSRQTAQTFRHWRAATMQCGIAKKVNMALLRKWFSCWIQRKGNFQTAKQFHVWKQKETARLSLISWSLCAKEHKGRRQMEEAVRLWLEGRQACTVFHEWVQVYRQHQVAFFHSNIHLMHRSFYAWRTAALETRQTSQNLEVQLCHHQTQSAFRTWRRAAASHKAVRSLRLRVIEADRKRLLSAVLQAWHQEAQAWKHHAVHLSEKYFSVWTQVVQRRRSERLLRARWRTKFLRRWRYRVVERREQRELTRLYWASWKNQTAASLLYSQQHEHEVLQRAWLTWRKRRIRNRVVAAYTASLNRVLLIKAFRLWWQRALVLGILPSRTRARSYSL